VLEVVLIKPAVYSSIIVFSSSFCLPTAFVEFKVSFETTFVLLVDESLQLPAELDFPYFLNSTFPKETVVGYKIERDLQLY
jgi:hypothetical protein